MDEEMVTCSTERAGGGESRADRSHSTFLQREIANTIYPFLSFCEEPDE